MSDTWAPTIVLTNKNPLVKKRETLTPGQIQKKQNGGPNGGAPVLNAKKIETEIENGDRALPPKLGQTNGNIIRDGRLAKKIGDKTQTRKDLAQHVQLAVGDIDAIENGTIDLIQANKLKIQKVCKYLGVKVSY